MSDLLQMLGLDLSDELAQGQLNLDAALKAWQFEQIHQLAWNRTIDRILACEAAARDAAHVTFGDITSPDFYRYEFESLAKERGL